MIRGLQLTFWRRERERYVRYNGDLQIHRLGGRSEWRGLIFRFQKTYIDQFGPLLREKQAIIFFILPQDEKRRR